MRILLPIFILCSALGQLAAQQDFYQRYAFTEKDSLRGSLSPLRSCFDVHYYHLQIAVNPEQKSIGGYTDIHFSTIEAFQQMQIDLAANMSIDSIIWNGSLLMYTRRQDAVFVKLPRQLEADTRSQIRVYYHGQPVAAKNPPWDGGLVWSQDKRGRPWIGVACEGDGASLWWPNKDHLSDEPDSVLISIEVPAELQCIANGNLRSVDPLGQTSRFNWFVSYPINNYNVTLNIGAYSHFSDAYFSPTDGDTLALDYYVIDYNEAKAKVHFQQTQGVLEAFEHYLGKYPYWNDGFALVETPYLGMEHQSAIAYGNRYMRGYLGGMIPKDMDWDYIIVHETGHEYFGNSISCQDIAEMWIHESFTTYLEALYVEYHYSYADALRYLQGQRMYIRNQQPVLGPMGVNWHHWEGSDHYYKGAWMLHTLRHAMGNDSIWWPMLKNLHLYHQNTHMTTEQIVQYINKTSGTDWTAFFDQYLRYPRLPTLLYKATATPQGMKLTYRWQADVAAFNMPVLLMLNEQAVRISPNTREWQEVILEQLTPEQFSVPTSFQLFNHRRVE